MDANPAIECFRGALESTSTAGKKLLESTSGSRQAPP
jgi:hypothetical protein